MQQHTHVQVLWLGHPECKATWEPATSLPYELVEDYERGIIREATVDATPLYGHVFNTMSVTRRTDDILPRDAKKSKQERLCPDDLEGYVIASYRHTTLTK